LAFKSEFSWLFRNSPQTNTNNIPNITSQINTNFVQKYQPPKVNTLVQIN